MHHEWTVDHGREWSPSSFRVEPSLCRASMPGGAPMPRGRVGTSERAGDVGVGPFRGGLREKFHPFRFLGCPMISSQEAIHFLFLGALCFHGTIFAFWCPMIKKKQERQKTMQFGGCPLLRQDMPGMTRNEQYLA